MYYYDSLTQEELKLLALNDKDYDVRHTTRTRLNVLTSTSNS